NRYLLGSSSAQRVRQRLASHGQGSVHTVLVVHFQHITKGDFHALSPRTATRAPRLSFSCPYSRYLKPGNRHPSQRQRAYDLWFWKLYRYSSVSWCPHF